MTPKPIKIWVTGATGLLGSAILRHLPDHCAVIAMARDVSELSHTDAITPLSIDISHLDDLEKLGHTDPPQWIIHTAAMTHVDQCEDAPQLATQINADGARHIARMAAEHNSRLIYISTDSIFDGQKGHYAETDATNPLNTYAKTKYQGEQEALKIHSNTLVVRTNFFGSGGVGKIDLASWFIKQLSTGDPVSGFEDVYFSPILSDTLAALLFELSASDLTGVLHVAGATRLSKYAFGQRIAKRLNIPKNRVRPTRLSELKFKAPRPLDTSLNCKKAETFLGRSMPDIETNLTSFFESIEAPLSHV